MLGLKRGEQGVPSNREAVARLQAFRQTETLLLSDIDLKGLFLLAEQSAEIPCPNSRMSLDDLQRAARPGAVLCQSVHSSQTFV